MNFIEAVKLLKLDKNIKIMRRNKDYEIILDKVGIFLEATSFINAKGYKEEPFIATINDILAEDWYVVKDEKLHSFANVIDALRNGGTITRKFWKNEFYVNGFENGDYRFTLNDVFQNDWIIIDEEDK